MQYQEYKDGITKRLNSAAEDFFTIGYYLRKISDNSLFTEDGYKSIWEFAKGEYNLSTSSASRFMAINERFSIDDGEHMEQRYIGMGVSKLQEMLGLPDEELEKVTQETTVREIRALKAAALKPEPEKLSFFGLPKTVHPEGSLSTIPGCGDGKHDCFSCPRECAIRQEARRCRTTSLANQRPCDRIDNDRWKKDMSFSMYKDSCLFLHPELAPIRNGDKEPILCCLECRNDMCYGRCDVAKDADRENKKNREKKQEQQREQESQRPEPTPEDIQALYDHWSVKKMEHITVDGLKSKHNNSGAYLNGFEYQARYGGVRINRKRELTWKRLVEKFKEIRQAADASKAAERIPDPEPEIIDAEFTEISDEPETEPAQEAQINENPAGNAETGELPNEPQESEQEGDEEPERDPEEYSRSEVHLLLLDHENDLKLYKEAECPAHMIRTERILVDALTAFLEEQEETADGTDGGEETE